MKQNTQKNTPRCQLDITRNVLGEVNPFLAHTQSKGQSPNREAGPAAPKAVIQPQHYSFPPAPLRMHGASHQEPIRTTPTSPPQTLKQP